jgi:hypothetical protein
MDGKGLF